MGGAMSLGMQRKMAAFAILLAGSLLGAGCGHRGGANPATIAALQPPPPFQPGPTYRIQVGDELHVRFLYQPDMTEVVPVRPDGRISLAATGELPVVGLTPTDIEQAIVQRSSAHLRNPEVTVIVTKLGEQRVYVGGEVERPGYVILRVDMTMTP